MLRYFRGGNKRTKLIWWALIVLTAASFVVLFIFAGGAGLGSMGARQTGAVATVNGTSISRQQYQQALDDQLQGYRQKYNSEPAERDVKMLEVQAWRGLVMQHVLGDKALKLGLKPSDREVLIALQTSPPPMLASSPTFQTDGKFDATKYQAALRDPSNNWAPFEQMMRDQLPVRKLQERLFSSIKLSEPELREAFRDRFERVAATVAMIPPAASAESVHVTDADLQRVYDKYKNRFSSGPQTQLEVLTVPKNYGDEEVRAGRAMAKSLIERARRGESFASLARDFSEGPGADKGGVIDRIFDPSEFGGELGPAVAALDTGQVTEPVQDGGRFLFFKVLERPMNPQTQRPGVRVAQIIVKVKGNDATLGKQREDLTALRNQATHDGLGRAASRKGVPTVKTAFYDVSQTPPQLYGVPEAADWGLGAKKGQVSPVFEGLDDFAVVQVAERKEAGPMPRATIGDQLRQIAINEAQIDRAQPRADAIAHSLGSGQTLEQAAASQGLTPIKVENITRATPDPRVAGSPELVGALFAARPGQVLGPFRGLNGYFFARVEQHTPADTAMYEQVKGQLSSQMLESRQRAFFDQFLSRARTEAKVKDLRGQQ